MLTKLFRFCRKADTFLIFIFLLGMVCSSFSQVIFRIVLKHPLSWTEELSRYLFIWLSFIGGALAVLEGSHFNMDFLSIFITGKNKEYINLLVNICLAVFSVVLVVYGWKLVFMVWSQKSPALRIPMSIPYLALPLNGVLTLVHLLERTIESIKILKKADKEIQ